MVKGGLTYDREAEHRIAWYPWLVDPNSLPDNSRSAVATMSKVGYAPEKDPEWASSYAEPIQDMMARGAARKISEEEMKPWSGPVFYASPKSTSTPVRIVSNSSQSYKGNTEKWAWTPGNQNMADRLIRGKDPNDVGPDSAWQNGPDMIYNPHPQWY